MKKEERRKKERNVWKKMKLEASLNTHKGRDIYEIPKMPLVKFTGYYILPSL